MSGSPAVFFDRDGTLMHDADYCSRPDQVRVFDGVATALRQLKQAGYKIIVITNQSGIGRWTGSGLIPASGTVCQRPEKLTSGCVHS